MMWTPSKVSCSKRASAILRWASACSVMIFSAKANCSVMICATATSMRRAVSSLWPCVREISRPRKTVSVFSL